MDVRLSGKAIDWSEELCSKADGPMVVSPSPKVTLARFRHQANACAPILCTLPGMRTAVREKQ